MSKDFARLAPFAQAMPHIMALSALVEGACPHAIYTVNENAAIIAIKSRLYLFGEMDFAAILQNDYFPQLKQNYSHIIIYAQQLPHGLEAAEHQRVSLKIEKAPNHFELPAGYRLAEVDAELVANHSLQNHASLLEEMCSERSSVDDFLAKSFGLCLINDEALVGWCLSEYNNQRGCEIGIEILEPYQRQGLGSALASAFIQLAQKRGIKSIGWHSWEANLPSVALAKKLGFQLLEKDRVFVLKL